MEKLNEEIYNILKDLEIKNKELRQLIDNELSTCRNAYPFNYYTNLFTLLMGYGVIKLDDYRRLRDEYFQRNPNIELFEMAPRTFGETWAQQYLRDLDDRFEIPNKKSDNKYSGEYDLRIGKNKVEVKASRVVRKEGGGTLIEKALPSDANAPFDMNFQQLKPECCDVFVWIAVWRDKIDYWVLKSSDVQTHKKFSNQHRNSRQGKDGGVTEGQIHINNENYDSFKQYHVHPDQIVDRIKELISGQGKG